MRIQLGLFLFHPSYIMSIIFPILTILHGIDNVGLGRLQPLVALGQDLQDALVVRESANGRD